MLCKPTLSVSLEEDSLTSKNLLGVACFDYLRKGGICYHGSLPKCWLTDLRKAEHLILSPLTQYEIVALQMITVNVLKGTAYAILNILTKASTGNKGMYTGDKVTSNMLKLSAKFGCSSHALFFILYCYKTGRYRKALSVIERTGISLKSNIILPNQELPISLLEGKSFSEILQHCINPTCVYDLTESSIDELSLEMQCIYYGFPGLFIPAFVLILMVEFLSFLHVEPERANKPLDELQNLVHSDEGVLIPVHLRDISWEILGICQQISGNLEAARFSYEQSLRQFPVNNIQRATRQRLRSLY